ncbi:MAG: hypothetical protein OXK79_12740 [Chloroflexota bacterium]|nr:hypothetical protein [Chloroflexota bacterium]
MPRQTEPNVNNALGDILRGMMAGCEVRSENTQTFPDHPGRHADVLIVAPGRSPVVVEAEFEPAAEVERDASERLGLRVQGQPRAVEAAIAVRYPQAVEDAYDVRQVLSEARLSYYVLHQDGTRFPESGWLEGSVTDLADIARLVSVPQKAVEQAADTLEQGIGQAATRLEEMAKLRPNVTPVIARLLGMSDVPQTRRMAGAIIANAMVFHQRIAGIHEGVKPLRLVCGPSVANPQGETLTAWEDILKINYWPIFAIAKDILEQLPGDAATDILRELLETAQEVEATGVDNAHDLTGRIFQRLIADRKYLATFYTLPASAALLARLAISKMDSVDWADARAIGKLRIGDFACGTGALLSAMYEQVASHHERAGSDSAALHPVMMEEVLYGCDVMPSAIHITGSTLSGMRPNVGFRQSRLYTMPYGKQKDGTVKIGSLELLQASTALTLFNTSDPALRTGSVGEETAAQINVDIPDANFDLVIMNPPFTRATNHEGAHADITNPAFAAFDATPADQTKMGDRTNQLGKDTCYHGNAGIASAFAALAHKKLKAGGVLALVLPLSAAAGLSWQGFRETLAKNYTDLTVLSIAASDNDHLSFSADTGMAECLVIARKVKQAEETTGRGHFVSLGRRAQGFAHAGSLALNVSDPEQARRVEDGPYGGTALMIGDELAGESVTVPVPTDGESWSAVRLSDLSLAQTAFALTQAKLWLPGSPSALDVRIAPLDKIATLGMVHRDITGPRPRGPFDKISPIPTATYPSLWNHDAKNETRMVCQPDSQLRVRSGMEQKAAAAWATASRSHINLDFRFNSQPLTAAFTEQESMGGRAWPNVKFSDSRFDYAFMLWANSTPGLLLYWWHSNRQHSGRGTTTIRNVEQLPILDLRTLGGEQLRTAETIFNELKEKELKPAYLADADPNRALLDRRVVCDLLGFDEDVYEGVRRLSAKWCAEPSVHGGKARPESAKLVS